MRIIKKKENKGFTLVEVIVSMLVLSITVVSVLSAFTVSSKSNKLTRKMQAAEALMEDVSEYAAAGLDSSKRDYSVFGTAVVTTPTSAPGVTPGATTEKTYTLSGVAKGFNKFNVKITENTSPAKYSASALNDYEMFSFGGNGANALMIDACKESTAVANVESRVLEEFTAKHEFALKEYNDEKAAEAIAAGSPTPTPKPKKTEAELKDAIQREIEVRTVSNATDKMELQVYLVYKINVGTDFEYSDVEEDKTIEKKIFNSPEFDIPGIGGEKIDQVYILFNDSDIAKSSLAECDIRIKDETKTLNCTMFLVRQGTATASTSAILYTESEMVTAVGSSAETKVSFKPDATALGILEPNGIEMYCSEKVNIVSLKPETVAKYDNKLLSGSADARLVEIKIEIIDPETGAVLLTDTEVHLQ